MGSGRYLRNTYKWHRSCFESRISVALMSLRFYRRWLCNQEEDYEFLTDHRGACHNRINVRWLHVESAIRRKRNRNPESTECSRVIGSKSGLESTGSSSSSAR